MTGTHQCVMAVYHEEDLVSIVGPLPYKVSEGTMMVPCWRPELFPAEAGLEKAVYRSLTVRFEQIHV